MPQLTKKLSRTSASSLLSCSVLTFNILLSVSAHFSAELSVRVKRGMKARLERGEFPGSRPLGFLVDGSVQPHSTKLDPGRAPLIRELFESVAREGLSLDAAREWSRRRGLRSRGGHVLAVSEIHSMLTNPAYQGMVRTEHGLVQGIHDPIISKELCNRVQEVVSRPTKDGQKSWSPLRGLLRCGHCARQIVMTEIEKAGTTYRYLHCYAPKGECSRPSFREEKLSDCLICVMEGIQLTPDMEAGIRTLVEGSVSLRQQQERERLTEIVRLKGEIDRKTRQRITAGRKYVEGTIDAADYASIATEIEEEIALVTDRIAQLKTMRPVAIEDREGFFRLLERAPERYRRRRIRERAKTLRAVTSDFKVTEENTVPVYRKPSGSVAEFVRSGNVWALLDNFRTSEGGFQALEDVVLMGSPWMADKA